MMKFSHRVSLFLLGVVSQTVVSQTTVSFLHINDHHSHFNEITYDIGPDLIPGTGLSISTSSIRLKYGGFPRVVGLMKKMEEEALAAGNHVCKLHAGDALTGTIYYTFFGSDSDAAVLNESGFDALTIGNHEFDGGDAVLANFINQLTFPVLSANVVPNANSALLDADGNTLFVPFIIKELSNEQKLGICGVTTKRKVENASFPDAGTTVREEVEAATECVEQLTAQGVNKIVLLTHIGLDNDISLLAQIPNVDVIVGGDSHTLLASDLFASAGFKPKGPYATIVNGVCIIHAWEYARVVGRLDVTFDAQGVVTACTGAPEVPLNTGSYEVLDAEGTEAVFLNEADSAVLSASLLALGVFTDAPADAAVDAAITPFRDSIATISERVIGEAPIALCHTRNGDPDPNCPGRDLTSCLGGGAVCNLVSQGFLFNIPNADFSIQNNGGCRTDILAGEITFADMFDVLPFANTLVTLEMTGRQIKAVLEDAANNFLNATIGGGAGSYPFAAGLRWDVDYNKDFPDRFSNVEANVRLEQEVWTPLDLEAMYTVATNSFIAGGRDGYFTFNEVENREDTFIEYAQSFINFLESIDGPLNEPPLSEFSSQRIENSNGRVCDAQTGISFPFAPSAAPWAAPSPVPAPTTISPTPQRDDCDTNRCEKIFGLPGRKVHREFFGICISECVFPVFEGILKVVGWQCGGCE